MGKSTLKACVLALSLCFLGCFDNNFKALHSEKSYKFSFNGVKKQLDFGSNSPYALAFFTKDCGVCEEQIRILNALNTLYDFEFLVVLGDAKDENDALKWAKNKNLTLPLFYEKRASEFLARGVGGIYGVPVIAFFDKKGILNAKFTGLSPQSVLGEKLIVLKQN